LPSQFRDIILDFYAAFVDFNTTRDYMLSANT